MKRDFTDFSIVPDHQLAIHARLDNWGRWCYGAGYAQMSPMFRLYRSSSARTAYIENSIPVDTADAAKIAKGVIALPEDHRHSINWYYINRGSPRRACQAIGCTQDMLAQYVSDGRQMMLDRKV